jgi:hypothetical protein
MVRLERGATITVAQRGHTWISIAHADVAVRLHAADHPIAKAATANAVTTTMAFHSIAVGFRPEPTTWHRAHKDRTRHTCTGHHERAVVAAPVDVTATRTRRRAPTAVSGTTAARVEESIASRSIGQPNDDDIDDDQDRDQAVEDRPVSLGVGRAAAPASVRTT